MKAALPALPEMMLLWSECTNRFAIRSRQFRMKCKCEIHFVSCCNCAVCMRGTQRNLYGVIKSCCDEFIHATLIDFITFKMELFLANDCGINSICKFERKTSEDRNVHYIRKVRQLNAMEMLYGPLSLRSSVFGFTAD